MRDLLLSDIDGTLVENNALNAEAWRQIGKGGDQLVPVFIGESDRVRLEPEIKANRKGIFHRD